MGYLLEHLDGSKTAIDADGRIIGYRFGSLEKYAAYFSLPHKPMVDEAQGRWSICTGRDRVLGYVGADVQLTHDTPLQTEPAYGKILVVCVEDDEPQALGTPILGRDRVDDRKLANVVHRSMLSKPPAQRRSTVAYRDGEVRVYLDLLDVHEKDTLTKPYNDIMQGSIELRISDTLWRTDNLSHLLPHTMRDTRSTLAVKGGMISPYVFANYSGRKRPNYNHLLEVQRRIQDIPVDREIQRIEESGTTFIQLQDMVPTAGLGKKCIYLSKLFFANSAMPPSFTDMDERLCDMLWGVVMSGEPRQGDNSRHADDLVAKLFTDRPEFVERYRVATETLSAQAYLLRKAEQHMQGTLFMLDHRTGMLHDLPAEFLK